MVGDTTGTTPTPLSFTQSRQPSPVQIGMFDTLEGGIAGLKIHGQSACDNELPTIKPAAYTHGLPPQIMEPDHIRYTADNVDRFVMHTPDGAEVQPPSPLLFSPFLVFDFSSS
jgi:hypothetical protein